MAEIINLRMARKARKRDLAEAEATAACARHGQSKAAKAATAQEAARLTSIVDGARLDRRNEDHD